VVDLVLATRRTNHATTRRPLAAVDPTAVFPAELGGGGMVVVLVVVVVVVVVVVGGGAGFPVGAPRSSAEVTPRYIHETVTSTCLGSTQPAGRARVYGKAGGVGSATEEAQGSARPPLTAPCDLVVTCQLPPRWRLPLLVYWISICCGRQKLC
jgi:hypothetical protein